MDKKIYIVFYCEACKSKDLGYVMRKKMFSSWSKAFYFKKAQETLGFQCALVNLHLTPDGIFRTVQQV